MPSNLETPNPGFGTQNGLGSDLPAFRCLNSITHPLLQPKTNQNLALYCLRSFDALPRRKSADPVYLVNMTYNFFKSTNFSGTLAAVARVCRGLRPPSPIFGPPPSESFFESRSKNPLVTSLLAELERYAGLIVLATNKAQVMDEAMHRRITLVRALTPPPHPSTEPQQARGPLQRKANLPTHHRLLLPIILTPSPPPTHASVHRPSMRFKDNVLSCQR